MSALTHLGRELGLGRLAYQLLFRPKAAIAKSIAEGGPVEQWRTRSGHRAMRQCALSLQAMPIPPKGPEASIAYLSGSRFWHQTVFCFASLQLRFPYRIIPQIFSDGTLDQETVDRIRAVIPWAEFVLDDEISDQLDLKLPDRRFPNLRKLRINYIHLRKLTDIHTLRGGPTAVADSDMLFYSFSNAFDEWNRTGSPFYIQDTGSHYGYPKPFLDNICGSTVLERVNVGFYGLNSSDLDWDQIESWCAAQLSEHGTAYLQEQALTAMALTKLGARAWPSQEYVVMPSRREGENPTAVLHHYVANSKDAYFRKGWRSIKAELEDQARNAGGSSE